MDPARVPVRRRMTSVRLGTISLISLGPQLQKYSQISSCRYRMDRPHVVQYHRSLKISYAETAV